MVAVLFYENDDPIITDIHTKQDYRIESALYLGITNFKSRYLVVAVDRNSLGIFDNNIQYMDDYPAHYPRYLGYLNKIYLGNYDSIYDLVSY